MFEEIRPSAFLIPQVGGMRVPGLVIGTNKLFADIEMEQPLNQVRNVAHLPGIVGYSIAMPDIHWGYGFPIGGVAAFDIEDGVISPGGVGYDINCGVRLAVVPLSFRDLSEKVKKALIDRIFHMVPSGVGEGHKGTALTDEDYKQLIEKGAAWSIEKGYGFKEDLEHIESRGVIQGADIKAVSVDARLRGRNQLGSVGSGNHFVEIGEISTLFLPEIAEKWGVKKGDTYILIHSGSRGFGHQVCQDALNAFMKEKYAEGLPDRQLVAAPIKSKAGQHYFAAMAAAANFAFNNRQQILHAVRQAFLHVCKVPLEEVRLIYDVCHNIAKFEEHPVKGQIRKLCVHRKGATRAFVDQPVLVPGDMGRASYLMIGLGNPLTWSSACHGAGRAKSRHQSLKAWGKGSDAIHHMETQGIIVRASSSRTIAEEMPDAYKDVNDVVEAVEIAGLSKRVAKLRPSLVLKG